MQKRPMVAALQDTFRWVAIAGMASVLVCVSIAFGSQSAMASPPHARQVESLVAPEVGVIARVDGDAAPNAGDTAAGAPGVALDRIEAPVSRSLLRIALAATGASLASFIGAIALWRDRDS